MLQLRPYQNEAMPLLRASMNRHQRTIYVLPTGGGKTVIFSEMIRLAINKGKKILTITDRIELFGQTYEAIARADGKQSPQILNAKAKIFDARALCTVAMVETLARRLKKGLLEGYMPDLIIIDECHKGNFNKILEAFPEVRVIAFTATPIGKHLFKYYTDIVQHIGIPELIADKYLLPCKAFQMQDDFKDVKIKAGEFDNNMLFSHFNKSKLYSGVVDKYKEKALGKKTLIFNVNIEHANNMNDEFNRAGIRSEVVTSETSSEDRARILSDFAAGRFPVLQNCSILTTGYDEPSIECIVVNRATMSLALWLQMNGRGSRTYVDTSTGEIMQEFICLDFGMNHDRHGLWCEDREWKLEAPKKRKKKDVAPVKCCPKCDAMLPAPAKSCEFCGFIFPIITQEDRNGVLVEIKSGTPIGTLGRRLSDLDISELIKLQKVKKYTGAYIWRVLRARGEESLQEYAKKMGYRRGWVLRQTQDIEANGVPSFTDYIVR